MAATAEETGLQEPAGGAKISSLANQSVLPTITAPTVSVEPSKPMEPVQVPVSPRLDAPQWSDAFASRVVWMAKEKHQFAELKLNPPELGSVNVKMVLHENDAAIAIGVHSAAVREAIEASLPRLRQLFAEGGFSLVNVDVSNSHGFAGDGRGSATGHEGRESLYGTFATMESDPFTDVEAGGAILKWRSNGVIDRYA